MVGGCGRYNPGFVRRVDSVCVSDDGNQSSYAAHTVWNAGVGGALDSTQCGGYLSVRLPAVASSVMCRKATQWRVQPCLHPPSPALPLPVFALAPTPPLQVRVYVANETVGVDAAALVSPVRTDAACTCSSHGVCADVARVEPSAAAALSRADPESVFSAPRCVCADGWKGANCTHRVSLEDRARVSVGSGAPMATGVAACAEDTVVNVLAPTGASSVEVCGLSA